MISPLTPATPSRAAALPDHARPLFTIARPAEAIVRENRRLTPHGSADVRHLVLGFDEASFPYVEGQAVGLVVPGGPGAAPGLRHYAIASARDGDDGRGDSLSICVKRGSAPSGGSGYLCDLGPGDRIGVVGPLEPTFPLPIDPTAPLLLIATGTGVASFRGLLRRIFAGSADWPGPVRLDHGARTRAEAVYADEFTALACRSGFALHYAISREPGPNGESPRRVDRAIEDDVDELWPLLRWGGASLYICGVLGMEQRVEASLARRALCDGIAWDEFRRGLASEGRFRISTS